MKERYWPCFGVYRAFVCSVSARPSRSRCARATRSRIGSSNASASSCSGEMLTISSLVPVGFDSWRVVSLHRVNDDGPFWKLDSKLALATAHRICATYLIVTTELQKVHGAECFKSFCRIASRFRFTIQRYRSADSSDILISFMLLAEFDETSR